MSQPLTGVVGTCSPNRPNPIGLHRASIVARDGLRIEVNALEAINGTPVADVEAGHRPARITPSTRRSCTRPPGPEPYVPCYLARAELPAQLIEQRRHRLAHR